MTLKTIFRTVSLVLPFCLLASAVSTQTPSPLPDTVTGLVSADVWADNWFAFYLEDQLVREDGVSIETERSFNAESFEFEATYPMQLNFILKDFRQDDSGLEYIGQRNQQMGDGGFIAQFKDTGTGTTIAVSASEWMCLVVHTAPLDKACEDAADPIPGEGSCEFRILEHPAGWLDLDFDDSAWTPATEFEASQVRPRGGYDEIEWDSSAKLIWTDDLEIDNTVLCRLTVTN